MKNKCNITMCMTPKKVRGMCNMHYQWMLRHGHIQAERGLEDLNNLMPKRQIDLTEIPTTPELIESKCDHSKSSCECINKGLYYKEYRLSTYHKSTA